MAEIKDNLPNLPEKWRWSRIKDISIRMQSGGTPSTKKPEYYENGTIPFVKIEDMSGSKKFLFQTKERITQDGLENSSAWKIPVNSILYSMYGSYGISIINKIEVASNQAILGIIPDETIINLNYLYYALVNLKPSLSKYHRGTTQLNLNAHIVQNLYIPVPPLQIQTIIVKKIEELETRLDKGVENLSSSLILLNHYRNALLKHAIKGRLTEAWRKQHGHELEPGSVLLKRILDERRTRWDEQKSTELKQKGKNPKNDDWKNKFKAPNIPNLEKSFPIPDLWTWGTIDQISAPVNHSLTDGPFGSDLKTSHYTDNGPRVIRLQNIGDGVFNDEIAHISEEHYNELINHRIFAGDIVLASLGEKLPKCCIVPDYVGPAIVKADCIRFKVNDKISTKYVNYILNSLPIQKLTESLIHGVGRPRLGLTLIRSISIPIPPYFEQLEIVQELEKKMAFIPSIEADLILILKKSKILYQSILKKAFEGRLINSITSICPEKDIINDKTSKKSSTSDNMADKNQKKLTDYL